MTASMRILLLTLLAALTQVPTTSALTTGAVLASLLVLVAVARQITLGQAVPALVQHGRAPAAGDLYPVRRQAIVAGPGRPQPRAPGARSRATS